MVTKITDQIDRHDKPIKSYNIKLFVFMHRTNAPVMNLYNNQFSYIIREGDHTNITVYFFTLFYGI